MVRRITWCALLAIVAVLVATPALAGGWAVVTLDTWPRDLHAGESMTLGFVVRQHGVHPVNDFYGEPLRPYLMATNTDGASLRVAARQEGAVGHFVADVTFPSAGSWTLEIVPEPFPAGGISQGTLTVLPAITMQPQSANAWAGIPIMLRVIGGALILAALAVAQNGGAWQCATLLWYHDHAMGITRFNVLAGLAGLWVIRDEEEAALGLPCGDYEVPLLIQDRNLDTNPDGTLNGKLLHKVEDGTMEFFGPFTLVNGTIWPYHAVEARHYRLRLLNGSNARTYRLVLLDEQQRPIHMLPGAIKQIGTDGGFCWASPWICPPTASCLRSPNAPT